jgi:hypothetical protein
VAHFPFPLTRANAEILWAQSFYYTTFEAVSALAMRHSSLFGCEAASSHLASILETRTPVEAPHLAPMHAPVRAALCQVDLRPHCVAEWPASAVRPAFNSGILGRILEIRRND